MDFKLLLIGLIVILTLLYWWNIRSTKGDGKNIDQKSYQDIVKSQMEIEDFTVYVPPISTITFYKSLPINYIYERTRLILEANPWLGSRIKTGVEGFELHYNRNNSHMEYILEQESLLEMSAHPIQFLKFSRVKLGIECQDQDLPLFDVNIIKLVDKVALVIALNHVLGDADTYFKIYKMYDPKQPIIEMTLERVKGVPEQVDLAFGKRKNNTGVWLDYRFWWRDQFPLNHTVKILKVDCEAVNRQKGSQLLKDGEEFISTNDILTSWIFKACRTCFGIAMFNLRSKLEVAIPENSAGNYFTAINYTKRDFIFPGQIRRSVTKRNGMYTKDTTAAFPSIWNVFSRTANLTDISNWVAFYHNLTIDGNEPIYHCPLVDPKSPDSKIIIFKPSLDEIYLHTFGLKDEEITYSSLVSEIE
ncbi:hypothetical protein HDV06_006234 [Boothiomyces sp. JEL0866]|nr:hypothetical protein HDV06_006234 [Boothiomyces sp. JEL0866]